MVQKSEKFFIFSWKEIMVIVLLGVISIGFFFTLGLHYGKKINSDPAHHEAEIGKLDESPDSVPSRDTLENASRHSLVATEDSIKSATQEEIQENGVKLEAPKQVDLPTNKGAQAPAKPVNSAKPVNPSEHKSETKNEVASDSSDDEPAVHKRGKFAIQLGSFPTRPEAATKAKAYSKKGVSAEVKVAVVSGSFRYRVIVTGFANKAAAESKAKDLKQKKKIDTFIIIKSE